MAVGRPTAAFLVVNPRFVYLHEPIDTSQFNKEDVPALRDRVREAIEKPVEEFLAGVETDGRPAGQEVASGHSE